MDFEQANMSARHHVYPHSRPVLCEVHQRCCLQRKMEKLGLKKELEQSAHLEKIH